MKQTIFQAAGGSDFFIRLAAAWHRRCLADPVVSHAFSHGYRDDHTERLAAYWTQSVGGPPVFTETMGDQSGVLRLHSGNGEHPDMDARSIVCFVQALDDVAAPAAVRATLTEYFRWGVGVMDSHPESADDVPAGLPLPQWSWDGLVDAG